MKYLLIFLFLFSGYSFAQNSSFTITKSEIFKDKKKHTSLVFSQDDGKGGVITVRKFYAGLIKTPKGYYIEHFDNDLKLISQTELKIHKSEIGGIFIKGDMLYLLEKKIADKKFSVNVLSSHLDNLNFTTRELFAFNEEDVKKYFGVFLGLLFFNNGWAQRDGDSFGEITFSANKKFMAFNFDIKDKENEVHRIFVYDDDFNKVYDKEFKKKIKDRYFEYENVSVDDKNGAVFFLGKVFEGNSRRTKKKGKVNYHYELYRIDQEGQQRLNFTTEEHFVASLSTLKGENYLSCVGFYSDQKENRYKGIVRFDIHTEDLTLKASSFQPFTEEFIIDKYGKKKEKELKSLRYRDIFMMEDSGDIIVNAEEYFVTTSYNMNTGTWYTYYSYFDIVSARITAEGKLTWARNINKKQVASNPVFNAESFTSMVKNDKVYIFLNGSKKIKQIRKNRIEFKDAKAKNYNLYVIEIDKTGAFSYRIIQDSDELEVPLFVSQGILLDNENDIIFLGRRKANKQLLKVSFND